MYDIIAFKHFIFDIRTIKQTELEKAKDIVVQLNSSIDWLNFEISKEKRYDQKSQLQKELTAATWERDRIQKEISKINEYN